MIPQSMSFNPVPIVSIHSTILAVLIAVISAYALHIHTTIDNLKTATFQQAHSINFVPPLPFEIDTGKKLSGEPEELLDELRDLAFAFSGSSHPMTKDMTKERDDECKRFCQVLTALVNNYPFPLRRPYNESNLDLSFGNLGEIRQWGREIQPILDYFKWALSEGNPRKEDFQFCLDINFNKPTKHQEMLKHRVTTDPLRYFSQTISDIVQSVNIHLNKVDSYQKRMPKGTLRTYLLITFGVFLFAVIIPIFLSTHLPATPVWVLQALSLWLPTVFYSTLIGYLVYKLN